MKSEELKKTDLTDDERVAIADDCLEWQRQLKENQENLLDLQLQFFETSSKYLTECRDRMLEDCVRFGNEAFDNSSGIFAT